MTKYTHIFELWFEELTDILHDRGISFSCEDSVSDDYEAGKNVHDVADEIEKEYR